MAERGRVLNLVTSVGDMLSGTVEMRLRCFLSGPDGHAIFKSPFFILTGICGSIDTLRVTQVFIVPSCRWIATHTIDHSIPTGD